MGYAKAFNLGSLARAQKIIGNARRHINGVGSGHRFLE